jgi:hypothetical protein
MKSETPLQRFRRKWHQTHLSCEEVAELYVPEGYTIEYRKSLSGVHIGARKLIKAPRPTTPDSLEVFLHECAHAHLKHDVGRKPRHVEEMEAEQWAHAKMAKHGIAVSPERMAHAKRYVARKIVQAERRGAKIIDARAREFAGVYVDEVRVRYDKAYGKSRHPKAKTIDPRAEALVNALVWERGGYSAVVMNGLEQVGRYSIDPTGRPRRYGRVLGGSW